jgi:hypothetical protein
MIHFFEDRHGGAMEPVKTPGETVPLERHANDTSTSM